MYRYMDSEMQFGTIKTKEAQTCSYPNLVLSVYSEDIWDKNTHSERMTAVAMNSKMKDTTHNHCSSISIWKQFFFLVSEIEPRVLHLLGRHSATELHHWPLVFLILVEHYK